MWTDSVGWQPCSQTLIPAGLIPQLSHMCGVRSSFRAETETGVRGNALRPQYESTSQWRTGTIPVHIGGSCQLSGEWNGLAVTECWQPDDHELRQGAASVPQAHNVPLCQSTTGPYPRTSANSGVLHSKSDTRRIRGHPPRGRPIGIVGCQNERWALFDKARRHLRASLGKCK